MATIVIKASGIVRAAAYMAKMADASVGVTPVSRTSSGFISPAMENPLATRTFSAVRAEARPMLSRGRGVVSITDAPNSGLQSDPDCGLKGLTLLHDLAERSGCDPFSLSGHAGYSFSRVDLRDRPHLVNRSATI